MRLLQIWNLNFRKCRYMTTIELRELLDRYKHLGTEYVPETKSTLIGRAPHVAPEAWLNSMYGYLSEYEIVNIEQSISKKIPVQYRDFLANCSNGLNLMGTTLCLFGYRSMVGRDMVACRQPFDIISLNKYKSERPRNATADMFFIGGYDCDDSQVYLTKDGKVHFCAPNDCLSLKLDDFLLSEIHRIYCLFDENGVEYDDSTPTTPI